MQITQDQVLLVINALIGLIGVPIVDWVKGKLGVDGKLAVLLTVIISIGLGIAVAFSNGALTGDIVSVDQVAQGSAVVFAFATMFFKALQKEDK
jgi:hypothetical protein